MAEDIEHQDIQTQDSPLQEPRPQEQPKPETAAGATETQAKRRKRPAKKPRAARGPENSGESNASE